MLSFIIAFLASALSGMGVGGGSLYILSLTLTADMPQLQAQGLNLAFFIISAISALLIHLQNRKINIPLVLTVSAFGTFGSLLGTYLAHMVSTALLTKSFGAFLLFCGIRTLFSKKQATN